jgi:DNA-binding CsgD family transcriptional regulator
MNELNPIVREVLTPREAEVAAQLLRGKRNKEIAEVLSVDTRTVKEHLRRMYFRFGILGSDSGKRILLARQLLGRA